VFTARYALSPYIKQIRFVFKGLIHTRNRASLLECGRRLKQLIIPAANACFVLAAMKFSRRTYR
jgi:hypothetical protein